MSTGVAEHLDHDSLQALITDGVSSKPGAQLTMPSSASGDVMGGKRGLPA